MTAHNRKNTVYFKELLWPRTNPPTGTTGIQEVWTSNAVMVCGFIYQADSPDAPEWIYIPTGSSDARSTSTISLEDLHAQITKDYLTPPPPPPPAPPKTRRYRVASADTDMIDEEIFDWSGTFELWESLGLDDDYSIYRDIIQYCTEAEFYERYRYGGMPSHSGQEVSIHTTNPAALKREIIQKIIELGKSTQNGKEA